MSDEEQLNGRSHGKRQTYLCKGCGRRFVPKEEGFERLHKDLDTVVAALDLYFRGLSFRKVAEHLPVAQVLRQAHSRVRSRPGASAIWDVVRRRDGAQG